MANATPKPASDAPLSFSDLLPSGAKTSIYPHLNQLDGQRIVFKDVGSDDNKKTFYLVLQDDRRYAIPKGVAEKCSKALSAAKNEQKSNKGNGHVGAQVQKLERGVRLS